MKTALSLVLALLPAQEAKRAPAVPSDRLPVLGTVGDLPKEAGRLVVEVDAKGRVVVDGKALDLGDFRKLLRDRADADREKEAPNSSRLSVVFRADRDLPWPGARWLMQECASPAVRVRRILFAARPEDGGEEGAVATFLPVDVGLSAGVAVPNAPPTKVPVKLEYDETELPVEPKDLYPALKAKSSGLEGKRTEFEIDASPAVHTGEVLLAVDTAVRFGTRTVVFRGSKSPREASVEEALAALPARRGGLVLTVLGKRVLPPSKDAPAMPAVERVKGDLAGILDPVPEPLYLETKPIEETPK